MGAEEALVLVLEQVGVGVEEGEIQGGVHGDEAQGGGGSYRSW